jgi:isoquinoline 1-oxidoreductase beta subunit
MHIFKESLAALPTLSRRRFLGGTAAAAGVFLLGTWMPTARRAYAQSGDAPTDPNVFLRIDADNTLTVISKHFEMGQGATTGLATLIAEELDADWSTVRFEFAPNNADLYKNLIYGVMVTGGSTSIANSWLQMRRVGAAARQMFVAAAAKRWDVPQTEIGVADSVVTHAASGRSATFGELVDAAMAEPVPAEPPLKAPDAWQKIGKPLPRLDSNAKTDGSAVFALDVRRPGALTAMLRRAPLFGAKLKSFDATGALAIDGVRDAVEIDAGVAVIADDTWSAMRGRDALKVEWDESAAETRSTAAIFDEYRRLAAGEGPEGDGLIAATRGDAGSGLAGAAEAITVEFEFPFLSHAPMEPLNCTMQRTADGVEIWSGCQLQSIDEYAASRILGITPDKVRIHTYLAGGSFGRRGNPVADWVAELAQTVVALDTDAPLHMVWTREDDIRGGFYRPMALHRVTAGLTADGNIAGWEHRIVSKPIFVGTPFESAVVHNGVDHSSVEGAADTPYRIGNFLVRVYNAESPVPVLWWRSVGHSHTAHVMETVIDELAQRASRDPVEFRIALLGDKPRDVAVIRKAAEASGWGQSLPAGKGRGFAYHFSFGTRIAMVADVAVYGDEIAVERIVAAVDCGVPVNPDVITAQVEGAIGFALSSVTRNRITLKDGRVEQSNFHDYNPTRIREMPSVEVHILPSTEAPSGIGEPGVPPLAPAIGNAVHAATDKRLRSLPLTLAATR